MVKFIDVDPEEIKNVKPGHRGRVSYPILKSFLETGKYVVMLDRTGMQQSFQGLYSALTSYVRNHEMPIKIFTRQRQIYLMRLDMDDQGNEIPNWREAQIQGEIEAITEQTVKRKFDEEKDKATK